MCLKAYFIINSFLKYDSHMNFPSFFPSINSITLLSALDPGIMN